MKPNHIVAAGPYPSPLIFLEDLFELGMKLIRLDSTR